MNPTTTGGSIIESTIPTGGSIVASPMPTKAPGTAIPTPTKDDNTAIATPPATYSVDIPKNTISLQGDILLKP